MNLDEFSRGKKKPIPEATGDAKFDSMLGKIAGNTEPQGFDSARAARVKSGSENPTDETIDALNEMMFNMHKSMQTANALLQKLTQGR